MVAMGCGFDDPLIHLSGVSFQYPASAAAVLDDVHLTVRGGDRLLLIGRNGSGKSTLLSLLAGRRRASAGDATVLGTDAFDNTKLSQHVSLLASPWPAESVFACSAARVLSPAPLPDRRDRLAAAFGVDMARRVCDMSDGQRRVVQTLHAMLREAAVYVLDECSTDMDAAVRRAVLGAIRAECETRRCCCVYATHILDGMADWATHIACVRDGRVGEVRPVSSLGASVESVAYAFLAESAQTAPPRAFPRTSVGDLGEEVIVCRALSYKDVFRDLSFTVRGGDRLLLCGCNGAGKTTLLRMMGGKQFFPNRDGALRILGRVCYADMSLNASVAFGGDWWCPAPPGEVYVREMLRIDTPRARQLQSVLRVDLDWDVRRISTGEQKRVQLLLHLLEEKPVVLLDEATADLDLDQRRALLEFLREESARRGVAVVYATHIFGGLDGWATGVMILDRTTRGLHAFWRGEEVNLQQVVETLVELKERERK